jgi:hypothetical protein
MEWLSGESLGDRLEREPLAIAETADILDQVCEALQAAHAKKIWHRDLKPDNLFLVPVDGRIQVKLLDFGIAKLADVQKGATSQTRTGIIMGTPDYMSPEQARGLALDGATDVYSLGVVVFEMLTGQLPFLADNIADLLVKHLCDAPPRPSAVAEGIPALFDDIVPRLLAKEAKERPSLEEFRDVLGEIYRNSVTDSGPATPKPASISVLRRRLMTPIPGELRATAASPEEAQPASAASLSTPAPTVIAKGKKKAVRDDEPTLLALSDDRAPVTLPPERRKRGRIGRLALLLVVLGLVGAGAAMLFIPGGESPKDAAGALADESSPSDPSVAAPDEKPKLVPKEEPKATATAPHTGGPAAVPSGPGFLAISSNVRARIFVDGDLKERNARRARVRVTSKKQHTVKIVAPRRRPVVKKVRVRPGDTQMVKVFLPKARRKRRWR